MILPANTESSYQYLTRSIVRIFPENGTKDGAISAEFQETGKATRSGSARA